MIFNKGFEPENARGRYRRGCPYDPTTEFRAGKFRKNQEKTTKTAKTMKKPGKNGKLLQNEWFSLYFFENVWFYICFAMDFDF